VCKVKYTEKAMNLEILEREGKDNSRHNLELRRRYN